MVLGDGTNRAILGTLEDSVSPGPAVGAPAEEHQGRQEAEERRSGSSHDPEVAARAALEARDHDGAITILMRAYGGAIFAYCRSMVADESRADDVLQLVFLQAHGSLASFRCRSRFKTWLFGIARHRCLDELKSARRRSRRFVPWTPAQDRMGPTADSVFDQHRTDTERQRALEECMQALSSETRELVLLRFRHGLTYEEIAPLTGKAAGGLRVKVFRALSSLRRCIEGKGFNP